MSSVAACITGTWRTFGAREVYSSLAESVVQPLVEDGWKVGLFYAIDTMGAGISHEEHRRRGFKVPEAEVGRWFVKLNGEPTAEILKLV